MDRVGDMAEKKAKRPPKTLKEKAFAAEYIKTLNATEAANRVYDVKDRDTARNIGCQNVAKLSFDDYFAAAGMTDEAIAQNIARIAFTAKKQNQFTGEVDSDDAIQLRGTELAIKIMGKFAPPRAAVDENGRTVLPILGGIAKEDHVPTDDGDKEAQ